MKESRSWKRWVVLLGLILLMMVLASCNVEQGKMWYKVRLDYTSIGDVARKHGVSLDDMQTDKGIEFISNQWAEAKYRTRQAGERKPNPADGWMESTSLTIPLGQVGVINWEGHAVTLPPRTYYNIPTGDDEIEIVPALFVQQGWIAYRQLPDGERIYLFAQESYYPEPARNWVLKEALYVTQGEIAWRMLPSGEIEYLYPQDQFYPYPKEEWQIGQALRVAQGQVAWRMNLAGELEFKYAKEGFYSELYSDWNVEAALHVNHNEMYVQVQEDGTYQFKGPGDYPHEPRSFWEVREPVRIGPKQFGKYIFGEGEIEHLNTGVYYDRLPENVEIYERGTRRYRTLSAHVKEKNPNPSDPACSSDLCEYPIDKVPYKGSNVYAIMNVDVMFELIEDADPEQFRYLGSMQALTQNYIAGPSRACPRAFGTEFDGDMLHTAQGLTEFGELCRKEVQARIDREGKPIRVTAFEFRKPDLQDEDLRALAQAALIKSKEAQNRVQAAQEDLEALESEDAVRQKRIEVTREDEDLRREAFDQMLQVVSGSNVDWQTLCILTPGCNVDVHQTPTGMYAYPAITPQSNE